MIPVIENLYGQQKGMYSYTQTDFEAVLEQLGKIGAYSDSTIAHYRHLIWVVYSAGVRHGEYPDNLYWGQESPDYDQMSQEEAEKLHTRIMKARRSFSTKEEIKLAEWMRSLDPETAAGEEVGLLLMYFLGLRNGEAVGANIGSVQCMPGCTDFKIFAMVQSESREKGLKAGGKTSNAPRMIPVIPELAAFLEERRQFLEQWMASNQASHPRELSSVDQLPLVCRGTNYTHRALSVDLSKAGRTLFQRIGIKEQTLKVLHQILYEDKIQSLTLDEQELTTYLFRRNFATYLYTMGFPPEECQYLIGHDIEVPGYTRSSFVDADLMRAMWRRMLNHPIRTLLTGVWDRAGTAVEQSEDSRQIVLPADRRRKEYGIRIRAQEPGQEISLALKGDGVLFDLQIRTSQQKLERYPQTCQVSAQTRKEYQRAWAKRKDKKEHQEN